MSLLNLNLKTLTNFVSKYHVYILLVLAYAYILYDLLQKYNLIPKFETFKKNNNNKPHKAKYAPNNGLRLVNYYADWCGWSQKLLPTWDKVVSSFDETGKCSVEKIDCALNDKNEMMCKKEKVEGYPSIILYKNETVIPYEGPRTAEKIIEFVEQHIE
jgi:thiol-disulfide isomerase/thioredoxin